MNAVWQWATSPTRGMKARERRQEQRYKTWLNAPDTITRTYKGNPRDLRRVMAQDIKVQAANGYDPGQSTTVPGKRGGLSMLFAIATLGVGALLIRPQDAIFLTFHRRDRF